MENLKWITIWKFPKYEINESLQVRHKIGKNIKSCYMDKGYLKLNLQGEGDKRYKPYLHQLSAWVFVPNPENKPEVHHIDEDKLNNAPSNLMWVTKSEHRKISKENGQIFMKVSPEDVVFIRNNYSVKDEEMLSKKFGIGKARIYQIATGQARTDIKEGTIHPLKGIHKKIVNIQTGEQIESSKALSKITGWKVKEIHRRLNGERYNDSPFRYVGMEHICSERPEKIIEPSPIAVFNLKGDLLRKFTYKKEAALFIGDKDNKRINEFLRGKSSFVKGYRFKEIDEDGNFIEPVPFLSKKPPLKPKKVRKQPTPGKPIVKYTIDGIELERFESIGSAAKNMMTDKRVFRKQLNKSKRNYYKGYIFKYA